LLAGVVHSIKTSDLPILSDHKGQSEPNEDVEPYDRSMSPQPVDITKLPYDERQIDIVTVAEDKKNLVR
jgi:hypothetical protein